MAQQTCNASHITWGGLGHQCLNCGATAAHSWDIKHFRRVCIMCGQVISSVFDAGSGPCRKFFHRDAEAFEASNAR